MLYQSGYPGPKGPSLVSDEFNDLCTSAGVEARVEPFPNPGNPYAPMRKINFRNYNNYTLVIVQFGKTRRMRPDPITGKLGIVTEDLRTTLPAKGECQILLDPTEGLPGIEKGPQ